jgi:pyruvate/2-oxoglutarate dehydrogenase complex dihydrolipoamide dehydrogenase (E3) component
VDAGTVEITLPKGGGTHLFKTKNILIATGGAPSLLDIPGAVRTAYRKKISPYTYSLELLVPRNCFPNPCRQ